MATTTLLSGVNCLIGAVDVSDQVVTAVVTDAREALENTSLGSTYRTYTSGLGLGTIELDMYNSYGAGEVEASLAAIVGTSVTITITGTSSALESASNPKWVGSNMYLESFTPINSAYGALSMSKATFKGGPLVRDITP